MYLEDWFATPLQLFATESDTLVITRLARLARSVVHLAQLAKRFEKENCVKLGRPAKLNEHICDAIHSRRAEGATIGQLAKEFELGEATIYRALKMVVTKENKPRPPLAKINV
ncbi:recombinase family protein [Vibrio parahaemolyticus]|nr:recombinase family protein [Vibrio parahaemolyticus]MDG2997105.1 recombinase family protein [Vibrio parahaemolyticus]